jgi:acyl-[acyl-carrier-protein]-phospholipid O-acyltransferase/long-chain-fatty-acid--[acyl-carrier-protein] ligase
VLNAVAAWLMLKYLPTNPLRDFVSILFRAFLRLEVEGIENIKAAGRAPILALNHVSYLDAALALTLTEEEPVFAIDYMIAQVWWVKPFLKLARAMPLNPAKPMSTRTLIKIVQGGDPLVIFPEGRITVTGSLMKVYDGAAMVADKTGSMVVPIRIDGLEKSYTSYLTSMHVRRRLFPKVKATILEPVKLTVPEELRGRQRRTAAGALLYQVMSNLMFRTQRLDATVLERIIATAKDRGMGKLAVEDPVTGSLSYGKLLTASAVLAAKFRSLYPGQKVLGVMLPNANGACAAVLGVMSAGKVPAMINFTAGAANILSACTAAEVRTVLTSRAFVAQAKLGAVVEEIAKSVDIVWLDELRETVTLKDKLAGLWRRAKPLVARKPDDPAVILFTSGSEGTPKGVVLSHRNMLANIAQAASRIDFHSGDKVFNVLPMFHSFGLTAGTVLPLVSGVPVYLYPSPLHYRLVPELVYQTNATIIFGTDTFLGGYARTAHPYDFRSVRYCFAGAEPIKASTRATYLEKFGVRILEGYGVTEAAPVIAINTPMYNKPGSVGKLMPGIEYRLEPVPGVDAGGRLFIRGPNVMAGYLRAEKPGVLERPEDGWHDTGDIVSVDDGFVSIRGRAKRFAKIGGEMVSLAAVEALAGELWKESLSAAATLPDDRKGEKLVLLTNAPGATRSDLLAFAKLNGAMDMMVPAEVRVVQNMPVLGTGKVDFVAVAKLVRAGDTAAQAA